MNESAPTEATRAYFEAFFSGTEADQAACGLLAERQRIYAGSRAGLVIELRDLSFRDLSLVSIEGERAYVHVDVDATTVSSLSQQNRREYRDRIVGDVSLRRQAGVWKVEDIISRTGSWVGEYIAVDLEQTDAAVTARLRAVVFMPGGTNAFFAVANHRGTPIVIQSAQLRVPRGFPFRGRTRSVRMQGPAAVEPGEEIATFAAWSMPLERTTDLSIGLLLGDGTSWAAPVVTFRFPFSPRQSSTSQR